MARIIDNLNGEYKLLQADLRLGTPTAVFGVSDSQKYLTCAVLEGKTLYIVADSVAANRAYAAISVLSGKKCACLSAKDDILLFKEAASRDSLFRRIEGINALFSGAVWGRPTWGAYWVWDARLTSELILLFLYLGFLALQSSIADIKRADKACALIALVGVVNVPIIYFSVRWWNTLHQGASITSRGSSIATIMLVTLLLMVAAFWIYSLAATFARTRTIILERERREAWAQEAALKGDI